MYGTSNWIEKGSIEIQSNLEEALNPKLESHIGDRRMYSIVSCPRSRSPSGANLYLSPSLRAISILPGVIKYMCRPFFYKYFGTRVGEKAPLGIPAPWSADTYGHIHAPQ